MKVAIIGTRGVPARYGGFETCAEELSVRLAQRGHDVWVYCRNSNDPARPPSYKGVNLIHLPSVRTKSLDTLTHTALSALDGLFRGYDVWFVFNAANSPHCVLPRALGKRIALNVDGLEWKRRKWGAFAKRYYKFSEWLGARVCQEIVSDSRAIEAYYREEYGVPSNFVAYGANIESSERPEVLQEYGLEPDGYFFVASRLEPENNADLTVAAFEHVKTDKQLVIAGGANYKSDFIQRLQGTRDPRIRFLGPVYKDGHIKELHCNCYAYVHGNEVGGTNPALLKALGYGNAVLAFNVVYNAEVVADAALTYERDPDDLRRKMQWMVDNPAAVRDYRRKAVARIQEAYTWDSIADGYEALMQKMLGREAPGRRGSTTVEVPS